VGLKLIFLVVSRAMSLIRLSRRESWWKDAEILMLRHQLVGGALVLTWGFTAPGLFFDLVWGQAEASLGPPSPVRSR
jgi:hypothetical protein